MGVFVHLYSVLHGAWALRWFPPRPDCLGVHGLLQHEGFYSVWLDSTRRRRINPWPYLSLYTLMPRCGKFFFFNGARWKFLWSRKLWGIYRLGRFGPLSIMIKVCGLAWRFFHVVNWPILTLSTLGLLPTRMTYGAIFYCLLPTLTDFWYPSTVITSRGMISWSLTLSLFPC